MTGLVIGLVIIGAFVAIAGILTGMMISVLYDNQPGEKAKEKAAGCARSSGRRKE